MLDTTPNLGGSKRIGSTFTRCSSAPAAPGLGAAEDLSKSTPAELPPCPIDGIIVGSEAGIEMSEKSTSDTFEFASYDV